MIDVPAEYPARDIAISFEFSFDIESSQTPTRPKPMMKCSMLTNPARHLRLGSKQAAAPRFHRCGGAVARASDDSESKGFFDANPTMSEASEPMASTPPAASSTSSLSSIDMDAMVEVRIHVLKSRAPLSPRYTSRHPQELSDTTELGPYFPP